MDIPTRRNSTASAGCVAIDLAVDTNNWKQGTDAVGENDRLGISYLRKYSASSSGVKPRTAHAYGVSYTRQVFAEAP